MTSAKLLRWSGLASMIGGSLFALLDIFVPITFCNADVSPRFSLIATFRTVGLQTP